MYGEIGNDNDKKNLGTDLNLLQISNDICINNLFLAANNPRIVEKLTNLQRETLYKYLANYAAYTVDRISFLNTEEAKTMNGNC